MAKKIENILSETEYTFDYIRTMYSTFWRNIGVNIFEWKRKSGKPLYELSEGLTSQQIEEYLYDEGKTLFVNDEMLGFLILKVAPNGKLNIYGKPRNFTGYGIGYSKQYSLDNAVLIKNNTMQRPTKDMVNFYCAKLADIEQTKDLQRNAHKTPFMLECDENTLLSAKNIFKQINANEPVIFKNKNKAEGEIGVNVLTTNAPYILDKLEDEYHNYEARILTLLGLDNYCEDKKERVQSAEVESQQEFIISSFRASLRERQIACEKINKMFGLDLYVDYVKGEQIETTEDVVEDEQIYSGIENDSK